MAMINLDDTQVRDLIEHGIPANVEGLASEKDQFTFDTYRAALGLNQDYFGQENQGESN